MVWQNVMIRSLAYGNDTNLISKNFVLYYIPGVVVVLYGQ